MGTDGTGAGHQSPTMVTEEAVPSVGVVPPPAWPPWPFRPAWTWTWTLVPSSTSELDAGGLRVVRRRVVERDRHLGAAARLDRELAVTDGDACR